MKKKTFIAISTIVLIAIIMIIIHFNGYKTDSDTTISKTFSCFDTSVTITIYSYAGDSELEDIMDECVSFCTHYESLFSRTDSNSDIYKINTSNGNPTKVNRVVASIINDSLNYSYITNGLFDITVAPLTSLWDIGHGNAIIPDEKSITYALSHVDYNNISVEGDYVTLSDADGAIDLGAIAKGFVSDKLKSIMISEGVTSAIIDLGGNILTIGGKDKNTGFNIGIKKPFSQSADDFAATIEITNKSVVTSGIYERYFEKGGKIYHHILDTQTGYPVDNNLYSVTVISSKSEDGDALSTSAFASGLKKGKKLINSIANVEAVFINNKNEIILTKGLQMDENNKITFIETDDTKK